MQAPDELRQLSIRAVMLAMVLAPGIEWPSGAGLAVVAGIGFGSYRVARAH